MKPYEIISKAGFDILFTGIITEKIMDSLKLDKLIGSFVTLEDASKEVGKICNVYKNDDIDLTILLTHIGYDSDIALAKMLNPEWGVDMIIGGHSHTILEKPANVNGILIAQAGVGSDQIGRFDIVVDDDTNSIVDYKWQLIPINDQIAEPDKKLEDYINSFKTEVDRKYNTIVTKFSEKLTHPKREEETTLGDLIADAFAENAQTDVMLVGSGSIRVKEMGPIVTLKDFLACFPYDDSLIRFEVTGSILKKIFNHIMRKENRTGEGECYQINKKVKVTYSDIEGKLTSLTVDSIEVVNDKFYTLTIQNYHFSNSLEYLDVSNEKLIETGKQKVVTTSAQEVLEEYLRNNQNMVTKVEGRINYS
jgi:5'-nucleotidase/UDP-sugar diphosphatase